MQAYTYKYFSFNQCLIYFMCIYSEKAVKVLVYHGGKFRCVPANAMHDRKRKEEIKKSRGFWQWHLY